MTDSTPPFPLIAAWPFVPPMVPLTALLFVLVGAALLAFRSKMPGQQFAASAVAVLIATLVLGGIHLANLYVLNKLRRRAVLQNRGPGRPPVAPDAVWGPPPTQLPA